jgi:photosystem II stability/assembly factor-like uncharacterized protein
MRYDAQKASWVPVDQIVEKSVPAPRRRSTAIVKNVSAQTSRAPNSKVPASAPATAVAKSTVAFRARVNDMTFTRDAWYVASEDGLFVSKDRGLNWMSVALKSEQIMPVSTSSANVLPIRSVRVGDTNSNLWALAPKQLEVSRDGGKTWVSRSLPFEPRGPLHLQPIDETTVVLASDHGVYLSRDAGESWHQANLSELLIDELTPVKGAMVVSTSRGALFVSRDGGKDWAHLDGPDAENVLSALRSRDVGNQLIAASATEGLFVLDMGAAPLASVDSNVTAPLPKQ